MKCPSCYCEVQKTTESGRCPECGIRLTKTPATPQKAKRPVLLQLLLVLSAVPCLFFGIIGLCIEIPETQKYYQEVKPRIETIDATISRIETYTDSDGDTQHTVYVDYRYGGKTYKDVELSRYSSSMDEGDEITVELDPKNPEELASSPLGSLIVGIVFTLVGCAISWFAWIKPALAARKAAYI